MATVPVFVNVGKWHINRNFQWKFVLRQDTDDNHNFLWLSRVRTREDLISMIISSFDINTELFTVELTYSTPDIQQCSVPPSLIRDDNDVALFLENHSRLPNTQLFVTVAHRRPASDTQQYEDTTNWFTRE